MVSGSTIERIRRARGRYPDPRAALLPALHAVQADMGYVPDEAIGIIAEELSAAESEVYGTATFYNMIRRRPGGRHLIQICHNLSCSLLGAESLIERLKKTLGVSEGEATEDGRFSIVRVECIGECAGAPAMLVDDDYYGDLTMERIEEILERYG